MHLRRIAVALLTLAAGAALLIWYAGRIGLEPIRAGVASVGSGFLLILLASLLRYVARAAAWVALVPSPIPLPRALAATIGGDAVGAVVPLGVLVGEPAKAAYLDRATGASGTFAPLAAENFFYGVSIAIYVMLGAAAMLAIFPVPPAVRLSGVVSLAGVSAALGIAAWFAWRQPSVLGAVAGALPFARLRATAARLREFERDAYGSAAAPGADLGRVATAEAAFHVLSFLEAWGTLWLLTGASLPVEAFVLDALGRVTNVVFRIVPLRLGVDQAGAGFVAQAIGLDPATGVALSLVRTARLVVWAAVGVAIVARPRT
jgi:hypothetical protein